MTELKQQFFQNLLAGAHLTKESRTRKQIQIFQSVPVHKIPEYIKDGWTVHHQGKNVARLKKPKSMDVTFEDQIWNILANMGFTYMNSGRLFKLPYSEDYRLTQQVDIIAIDDETILIIECKAAESLTKNRSFKESIEAFGGKKEGIINTIRKVFPDSKHRIKFIFATDKYILPKPDIERLVNFDITYLQEEDIEYYKQLTDHLGFAAKYQLLGNLFQGQKIPELNNKVPAIKGKLGPYTVYFFSIDPERLLKIGYVLHRTAANKKWMPTYQRIIKKERLKNLETFISKGGFFPNSVTISIDTNRPLQFDLSNTQCEDSGCKIGILSLPQKYRSAYLIDGQHRVYGYAKSKYKSTNLIPVVAFECLERSKQVELFMQINENQKAVAKSLRNTLNAERLWNSEDLTEAIKAIKLRIAQELGEDKRSPLYAKVIIGENKPTLTRCITIDTIYTALDRGNFFGTVSKDSIKQIGTFYDGNAESTFERLKEYLELCLDYVKEHFSDNWELGERENGYLAINATIYALILIFSDICDHLVKTQGINPRTETPDSLAIDTTAYLDSVIRYFRGLTDEERAKVRRSYGTGGRTKYWRTLQRVINDTRQEFEPEGLDQYSKDSSKRYNTQSFEMVRDIETYMKGDIKEKLYSEYGLGWWKKGVPLDVYEAAELLATKKNREIDDPSKEEDPWNQIHLIDYRKIILHNWGKLFQQKYSFPGVKGDKNEKTAWLVKLNSIRNQNFHEYSVSEEEFNFLKNVHDWIRNLQLGIIVNHNLTLELDEKNT